MRCGGQFFERPPGRAAIETGYTMTRPCPIMLHAGSPGDIAFSRTLPGGPFAYPRFPLDSDRPQRHHAAMPREISQEAQVGVEVALETMRRMYDRNEKHTIDDSEFIPLLACAIEASYHAAINAGLTKSEATWMRNFVMKESQGKYVSLCLKNDPECTKEEAEKDFQNYLKGKGPRW